MTLRSLHQLFLESNSACTDTRKITKDCMFFALKGENFDGNTFAKNALENGAKYAIIDTKEYAINAQYILVDNVLTTLQQLAKYHRDYLNVKIIALTGSNGKTTTKELINCVLQQKYRTIATQGNLNNHIGVPITLLSMDETTKMGIVEMGANHLKEIDFLCNIAQPDYGYITNFGKAHLEGFGSIEGVIKGKCELYNYLITHNKSVFLNADDHLQREKLNTYIKKYGFSENNSKYYNISLIETNPFISLKVKNTTIISNLIGKYNFSNLSAAILVGTYFNVPLDDIKKGIEAYIPANNRSQIIEKDTNKIILDAYNANPTSMKAALHSFTNLKGARKIAILGDMFELGKTTLKEHQDITDFVAQLHLDEIYLVGEHFFKTSINSSKVKCYTSFEDLKEALKTKPITNSTLLIKGSRGMALERVLDLL